MKTKQLGSLLLTIAILAVVLNAFFTTAIGQSEPVDIEEDVNIVGGSGELSWDGPIDNFSIQQSLGTSVAFTGANDSELQGEVDAPHDDTWSVSLWAAADTVRTQRAAQLDGWLMVDLVNDSTQPEWRITYYDDGDWEVDQVSINATDPTTMTNLVITGNGSEMAVYRNNTHAATVALDGGDQVPTNVSNWDGRLEETRVLDDVVNSSQRNTLYSTPTAPVKANETARVYFDARADEDTIDVYRTGQDLTISNASVVDGFDGQQLEDDGLFTNGDYRRSGGDITVVDDGKLDGAPVAFVAYIGQGGQVINLAWVGGIVNSGMSLLALAGVVGGAVVLLNLWNEF